MLKDILGNGFVQLGVFIVLMIVMWYVNRDTAPTNRASRK